MSNLSHSNNDLLWQYLQSLEPETVSQLSQPNSPEVFEVIQKSIVAMLGNLPHDRYNTTITTNREQLGKLLGSAMIDGYFLRNAEQRLEMDQTFQLIDFQK
ncbi:MAG: DUF760 domain-containing protein [Nostocales cyanobacterium]|nr:MAG: DUF760 domain-containing protein [Nostocales cyanobacterium]